MITLRPVPLCECCGQPMVRYVSSIPSGLWMCDSAQCRAYGVPTVVPRVPGAMCVEVALAEEA